MAKFEDMFGATPYQVGPMSPAVLDEIEREKKRKELRETLKNKRAIKIQEKTQDRAPELSDEMLGANSQPAASAMPDRVQPQIAPSQASQGMMPLPRDMMPEATDPDYRLSYGKAPEYNLGMEQEDSPMPVTQPFKGALPSGNDRPDSRQMLYDYLKNRRESEPEFQNEYKDLSNQAETGRVLNTFASGLGEMASMAGQVGGKRADTGDMKALPNAIYGGMRKQADETLGLRRLANQEQVSDIRLLRDLERGDLDALRTQKILADLNRQKSMPKTTQFYNEGDPEKGIPPSTMVIDNNGQWREQKLPMGTKSMANNYTLGQPLYTPEGKTIIPQTSKGGSTRYLEAPGMPAEGLRIRNQAEADKAEARLKEIEEARKTANDTEKRKLDREEFSLKKAQFEWSKSKDNRQEDRKDEELDVKKSKATQGVQKQTEFEKKSALQGSVALKALEQVELLENGDPNGGKKPYRPGTRAILGNMAGGAGGLIGNRVLSDDDRLYDTASNQLVEMLLRNVTGAAAQKDEIRRMMASYKIQGGDDEATIRYKQESRKNFVNGILQSGQKGGLAGKPGKAVTEKKYSPSRNKTKITYSDGSTEIVEGRQ